MIYLASPYSSKNTSVQKARFQDVARVASFFMKQNYQIFSPIAHTHPIAEYGLPRGWEFWAEFDEWFISRCNEIWVLMLEGWKESTGVNAEIKLAEKFNKKIRYVDPYTMTLGDDPNEIC